MPSHDSKPCSVARLTEREDMTTDSGFRFAQCSVNNAKDDTMVFICSAVPCTGGSHGKTSTFILGGAEAINII